MADNQYKILLGTKLDTSDIQTQINAASKSIKPIELKVDAETKELTNTIKEALSNLSKGTKNALTLDTSKLEASLNDVTSTIREIKTAIGTLDSGSNMKSLVSSINQISAALDKASDKFDGLIADLKSLSGKDFNLNFGINLGGSNSVARQGVYGNHVRSETLPELQKQAKVLQDYFKEYYKVQDELSAIMKLAPNRGGDIVDLYSPMSGYKSKTEKESLSKQMGAYREYINIIKEAASLRGIDISHITSGFSKSADQLVQDAQDIQTGAKEMDESFDKLKQIFGGGNNLSIEGLSASLEPIVADLNQIREAVVNLSKGVSLEGLTQSFNRLSETIEKLVANVTLAKSALGDNTPNAGVTNQTKAAQETAKAYQDVTQEAKKLNNISIEISEGNIDDLRNALKNLKVDDASIEKMINKLNEMNIVAEKVSGTLKNGNLVKWDVSGIQLMEDGLKRTATLTTAVGKNGATTSEKFSQAFDKAAESVQRLKKEAETANKIRFDIETEKFENKVSQLHTQLDQLTDVDGSLDKLRVSIKQVDDAYEAMIKAPDDESLIQAQKRFAAAVEKTNNELKIQAREQRAANNATKLVESKAILQTEMLNWLKKNSKATKEYKTEIDRLIASLDKLDQAGINGVRRQFNNITKDAEYKGLTGLNFLDSMKSKIKEYSVYFGAAEMFMYAEQGLRDMFEQVKLIDSAMTELKKVTNETDAAYDKFLTNAADRAKAIGTTIDGLVSSTADFARLGYGFEDAQGLAEVANIYAVVGDEIEGVEGATESLISTMAAFKSEMNGMSDSDFAMSIIDKFNEIGNNFAISSGGIGEALERSASSLMAANNTIDESIALITAANTVVQDPEAVGTAFKTISMRIRGAKTELEAAGLETEGMVDSTAKLRSEIMALTGVDIMDGANQFKSTYKIMDELAQKWEDLSDIQQATVTELIAGKRQGNIVSSLMTNFDTAREALETSLNSAGSAMQEHEKWQQSLESRILSLKASWQALSQSFMDSNFLRGALEGVIKLVDGITKLMDTFGTLPTLVGVFAGGLSAFKNQGLFKFDKDVQSIKLLGTQLTGLKGKYTEIHTAIDRYNSLSSKSASFQERYNKQLASSTTSVGKYLSSLKGSKATFSGYIGSLVGATVKTIALEAATIALNAALTMGISFAIQALITAFDKMHVSASELSEEVEELTSKFQEEHNELQKLKSDYDTSNESSMISKYSKLSKGVDSLGRNVSLTADEYSEYQSIVNKIAEQIPSLVSGYDSQGNALLSCKDNVEALTQAYENMISAQNRAILNNAGKIGEDFANAVKENESTGFKGDRLSVDVVDEMEKAMGGAFKAEKYDPTTLQGYFVDDAYAVKVALEKAGLADFGWTYTVDQVREAFYKAVKTNPKQIQNIIDEFRAGLEADTAEMKTIAQATLSEAFDISDSEYYDMSDTMQSLAKNIVNGFDYEFYKQYKDNPLGVQTYINNMLDQLQTASDAESVAIEAAFNLKTQFNNGEVTYGEYAKGIQEAKDIINGLDVDSEIKNTIKLSLDDSDIQTQYNHIRGYLRDFYDNKDTRKMDRDEEYDYKFKVKENDKKVEEFLKSLTADELAAVIELKTEIDWENTSAEDIRKEIEDRIKLNEALNFETSIEVDKTALEALNTVLEESASAMGLSEESIDSLKAKYAELEGYNPHTLFEKTANGVKVNRDELAKLEKKYNDLKKTEVQEHLDALVEEYNDCTKAIDGNIDSTKKLELINKREKYAQQIQELAEYQAQLEGVTGAYQRWIDAQNTPEDYEGYEKIATSREDIEDEISRGFLSNSTKEYIDLLSGKDLVGGTIDDYYNAWKKLDNKVGSTDYSINDFFTVNDDGDITSTGIDRFFKGIQQDFEGSIAEFDKETQQWQYNFSQDNLQKIQDEWGIGIEAIELLLEAAAAAGYDVDWGGMFDDLDIDISNFESIEAMISLAEKAQEELNKIKGLEDVEFNFRTNNIEEATTEVEKARKTYVDLITNDDGSLNLKAEGAEQMQFILSTLLTQKQSLSTPAIMKVDTSQIDKAKTDVIDVINKAKELQTAYENYEIAITTGVDVEDAKKDLNSAIAAMEHTSVDVRADLKLPSNDELKAAKNGIGDIKIGASLDDTSIGAIATKIQTECTPKVIAKVTGLDQSAIEGTSQQVVYTAEHSDVDNFIDSLTDISKKIIYTYTTEGTKPNPSNINRSITYKYKTEGDVPEANGTANVNGTTNSGRAFARGNWGIKGSGTALVGELGMETLVRGSRFYTIGDNGAEFIKYKQGDIIFNHKQTEELFKNGKVTSDGGRGRMFANGSAYAEGSALWQATASGSKFASNRISKIGGSGNSSKSTTKKKTAKKDDVSVNTTVTKSGNTTSVNTNVNYSANVNESDFAKQNQNKNETVKDESSKFEDVIDWIETILDRAERAIDKYEKQANNVYKTWDKRNKALENEIAEVGNTISLYEQAKNKYLSEANSVGLDANYAAKVRNGSLSIEDFKGESDEKLVEKIKNYQDLYNKYLDCIDKIDELKEQEASLYAQRFENVQSEYENLLQGFDHTQSMLEEYINQAEAKGHIVSKEYYNALIDNEENRISKLKQEQSALIKARDEAVANDEFDKYSEEWYSMCQSIDKVTQAIEAGTTSLIEYNNAIRDIDWEVFDLIQERISDVTEEANFLIDLMSYDKLFDDNGKLTDKGLATMGLHGQNYNTYMYQADDYGAKVQEIDDKIASGKYDPYDQNLLDKRQEYLEAQREAILNAEQEKEAIKDLVSEGIELELDALQELIDKKNEELQSAKDLYDYNKKVKEQTEEIASLEKQMAAYSGDDSEEAQQKIQQIKVDLKAAREDLKETEWDKYIDDTSAILDELYNDYELILNTRLDNIDALLSDVITEVNNNASTISSTLTTVATDVGTQLSDAMSSIWAADGTGKAVVDLYGVDFQNKLTTTNSALSSIKSDVATMVNDVNEEAEEKIEEPKTQTSAVADPTKSNNTNNSNNDNKNNNKTTDKSEQDYYGVALAIWNGNYGWGTGATRKKKLKEKGFDPDKMQSIVNKLGKDGYVPSGAWQGKYYGIKSLPPYHYNKFALGAKDINETQLAWTQERGQEFIVRPSDGAILTPIAKGDSVLTSAASSNIWKMANSPAEFIKDNLNLGVANTPNNSNVQSSYTQILDKVVFNLPNVKNYEELLTALQKDPKFDKLIKAMTIDQIAGKSSLAKNKSIR